MYHILVIDDENLIRTLLRGYLESKGFSVGVAQNGKQALELFEKQTADLIITDVFMPEKDGLEVVMALRKKRPDIPIVVVSGGSSKGFRDMLHIAKTLGAARVLEKPFKLEELLATVQALLPPVSPPAKS